MIQKVYKLMINRGLHFLGCLAFLVLMTGPLAQRAFAYPQGTDPHSQFLGGPYELLVKQGMQGSEMVFPVQIENENAPGELNTVFPVMGSSTKIRLQQYLPELVWEQYTEKSENGGWVIKLKAVGPDMDQVLWLCTDDPQKQSISSPIGGMQIKPLKPNVDISDIAAQLADSNAIGILSVYDKDPNEPKSVVVSEDSEINVKDASCQFKVLEYMPHYSVDVQTKEITNASPEPKNPAIKVQFTDGKKSVEQWFFTRFLSHPHKENKIPLHVEFTDIDLGTSPGNYIILAAGQDQLVMLFRRDGKKYVETVQLDTPYPLAGQGYNLILQEISSDAVLKQRWKNNRDQLLNPAVIAAVDQEGQKHQVALELNKPQHVRSGSETMVMLFRRKVETAKHLE